MKSLVLGLISIVTMTACSTFLKYEKVDQLKSNDEFATVVKIQSSEEIPETPVPATAPPPAPVKASKRNPIKKASIKKKTVTAQKTKSKNKIRISVKTKNKAEDIHEEVPLLVRQPDIENSEGFRPGQRRPIVDPFRVGETVIHEVSYFKLTAGEIKFKVEPFQIVNGHKSYTFATEMKTVKMFSSFYSVDDRVETLVDFEDLAPRVFSLHVKESSQLREARSFFDNDKNMATYWEKKVTEKSGVEEKKQSWEILPFSQNVYSAIFYMRVFKWEVGKEYSFRVADDEQNIVFKGTAVRKEELKTEAGTFNAIVIKPEITVKGAFKPIGDIYFWLSDDDRKYVLRIESKIKIGTLTSQVVKIVPGK